MALSGCGAIRGGSLPPHGILEAAHPGAAGGRGAASARAAVGDTLYVAGLDRVTAFAAGATGSAGSVVPDRTITGDFYRNSGTDRASIAGISAGLNATLHVIQAVQSGTSQSCAIFVYAAGADGAAPPQQTPPCTGSRPHGVSARWNGAIDYLDNAPGGQDAVERYRVDGTTIPRTALPLPANSHDGLAVDAAANVFVTARNPARVDEYAVAGAGTSAAPVRTLALAGTPGPIAVADDGTIYVAVNRSSLAADYIYAFAPGATSPSRTLGPYPNHVTALAVDDGGLLYAGITTLDKTANRLKVYASDANGSAAALRTLENVVTSTVTGDATITGLAFAKAPVTSAGKIDHVVIIVQENRTVDNLFNGFPGADTVPSGYNDNGDVVPLQPVSLSAPYDIDHTRAGFVTEYNHGVLNGFSGALSTGCANAAACLPPEQRAYGYVPRSEAEPYWQLALQYTLADRMFQTNQGPSFPAHQYLVSGTSIPSASSSLLVSDNPGVAGGAGCDAPAGTTVPAIDPASGDDSARVAPCFERQTLMDLLDQNGYSWRHYQPTGGATSVWYALDAILHIRYGPQYANLRTPSTTIFDDIQNGTLANVSWVIPTAAASDHATVTDGTGPDWVASIVNAVGASPYWNSTAIFVTWDDWGGWYDHVPPPIYNAYEDGFRVPLIVVSPYARKGYVSHVQHEFGSILKFTEAAFGLASLGYTDDRSDDLMDCFNFVPAPAAFHAIGVTHGPAYFKRLHADLRNPDRD